MRNSNGSNELDRLYRDVIERGPDLQPIGVFHVEKVTIAAFRDMYQDTHRISNRDAHLGAVERERIHTYTPIRFSYGPDGEYL